MSGPGARPDDHRTRQGRRITEAAASRDDVPPLPADRDGPVFHEPWQATAFALAVHLSERGAFPWTEWSAALGREIQAAADPADADGYFQHWLDALERLCADKGMVDPGELRRREDAWRRAYLNTPHGEPVQLAAAPDDPHAGRQA